MAVWKVTSRRLKKLRQLSPSERRVLAEAMFWLPVTGGALRVLGYQRVHAFLTRREMSAASATGVSDTGVREAKAAARMVKAAIGHGLYRATCLPESLVLWSLLRRRGLRAELRIGTRKDCDRFAAHAWVEMHGTIINDTSDVRTRFASFERNILAARTKAR